MDDESKSLALARLQLGKAVTIRIDRPIGSAHPKHGFIYGCNYGFLPGVLAPDGEELDAYLLHVTAPVTEFTGEVVAIIHRLDDDDDKLVVVPEGETMTDNEIERAVEFQEKWFDHVIVRGREV